MKLLLSLVFLCFGMQPFFAQHSTLRFSDAPFELDQQSLLLVPFEKQMYLSDINKELGEYNQLNYDEIYHQIVNGIDQSIYYTFKKRCDVNSFYAVENEESDERLKYIYSNLKLEYELVSKSDNQSKLQKFKNKFKKKEKDQYHRGEIREGQIITKRDDRERYMKAVVEDQKMLDSMQIVFDNKFFLFINQLDIKNQYTDAIAMQNMDYQREIKLHYTLYHQNGEMLLTGISSTSFPSTQNDLQQIIKNHFPILAQNIFNALFEIEESKEKKN